MIPEMTEAKKVLTYIQDVITNMPADWLNLTTHRLDIYEEKRAKVQFLEQFEALYQAHTSDASALADLPTAYDYIRLGHPLSSVLEWAIAKLNDLTPEQVISFSSKSMPLFAVLRKNALDGKATQVLYTGDLPDFLDPELTHQVYEYDFVLRQIEDGSEIPAFEGSTVLLSQQPNIAELTLSPNIDFFIGIHEPLGSVIAIHGEHNEDFVGAIQHVRRRETIAMTPADTLVALQQLTGMSTSDVSAIDRDSMEKLVRESISEITGSTVQALVASSGLSMQYAIVMGLIHEAAETHPGKPIHIVVPSNCYGGTNDQARRVAASIDNVEIIDLQVDGDHDMVMEIGRVLEGIAQRDAVPYIIAEIPTNPRVEVPDLQLLKEALTNKRTTPAGEPAIEPVFILDQTFCPNVHFLGDNDILSSVSTIAYVSGSKFPSGGRCTAGYCVANQKAAGLMDKIDLHLRLCDNEATDLQLQILSEQLPSMIQRIEDAYQNTRQFVTFIQETLPKANINFVSEELAAQGFTPSVFSLDLPTKGNTEEERETYKRALNHQLITMMIQQIPNESKYCVSYGQLKGCYWTIPATSTQGTTKEGDKDYITRVALSGNMDLERHKEVFAEFVGRI